MDIISNNKASEEMVKKEIEIRKIEDLVEDIKKKNIEEHIVFTENDLFAAFNYQDGSDKRKYDVIDVQKKAYKDTQILSKDQLNELIKYALAYQTILQKSQEEYFDSISKDNSVPKSFK